MRAPWWIVPGLVVTAATLGVTGARLFARPSVVRDYAAMPGNATVRATTFLVEGVRCVDTAERAARQLDDEPGVLRLTAWAPQAKLEITFDPARTDVDALRAALEGPVYDASTGEFRFGVYVVLDVDGVKVPDKS